MPPRGVLAHQCLEQQSHRSSDDPQAIRDWANSNGYNVSSRGRVKQEILDAYDKVN